MNIRDANDRKGYLEVVNFVQKGMCILHYRWSCVSVNVLYTCKEGIIDPTKECAFNGSFGISFMLLFCV